jgi:transcriptional regulator with XRE-family HTH domain
MENNTGSLIREYRKMKGWSQKRLSQESGVNESSIKQYELGTRNPKPETLQKIAEALEIDFASLNSSPKEKVIVKPADDTPVNESFYINDALVTKIITEQLDVDALTKNIEDKLKTDELTSLVKLLEAAGIFVNVNEEYLKEDILSLVQSSENGDIFYSVNKEQLSSVYQHIVKYIEFLLFEYRK